MGLLCEIVTSALSVSAENVLQTNYLDPGERSEGCFVCVRVESSGFIGDVCGRLADVIGSHTVG